MAETRSVDVNIVVMEKPYDGSGDSIVPKVTKVKAPEQANRTDNTLLSSSTSVLLHEAYNYAKQEVTQIASYETNKYFNLHDDYGGRKRVYGRWTGRRCDSVGRRYHKPRHRNLPKLRPRKHQIKANERTTCLFKAKGGI